MGAKREEQEKKVNEMLDTKKMRKYPPEPSYTSVATEPTDTRRNPAMNALTPTFLLAKRRYMIYAIGLGGS